MKSFGLQQLIVLYINWKERKEAENKEAENKEDINGIQTV